MEAQKPTNGKAVTSMILGIVSLVIPFVGLITGIIGLILANSSLKEIKLYNQEGKGMAIAGKVCSIIAICMYAIAILIFIIIFIFAASSPYYY